MSWVLCKLFHWIQVNHFIHVFVLFLTLMQPEAGVWEAGQWEDWDAEALHHGESSYQSYMLID